MRFPDQRTSIITLCNVSNSGPTALSESVARAWLASGGLAAPTGTNAAAPDRPAPVNLSDAELRAFAGRYSTPELTLPWTIDLVDHQLRLRVRKGPGEPMTPVARDTFTLGGTRVTFDREGLSVTNRGVERLRLTRES
jgi:hypothetical protein